jgi:hypothetical protein
MGTSAIFTAGLSMVFLSADESLTWSLATNIAVVFAGISVIAVG